MQLQVRLSKETLTHVLQTTDVQEVYSLTHTTTKNLRDKIYFLEVKFMA